ncbi:hypothetical protein IKD48_00020 [bacterium]|nr:hypothetical protein [bacterium]
MPRTGFITNDQTGAITTVTGAGNFVDGVINPSLIKPGFSDGGALGGGLLPT